MTFHALTLAQPWPVAFDMGKRIENRSWAPWPRLVGEYIALHGGVPKPPSRTRAEEIFILGAAGPNADGYQMPLPQINGVFALIRIVSVFRVEGPRPLDPAADAALAALEADPWFFGPYGWVLDDYVRLPKPIQLAGGLGLWSLPARTNSEVLDQVGGRL